MKCPMFNENLKNYIMCKFIIMNMTKLLDPNQLVERSTNISLIGLQYK